MAETKCGKNVEKDLSPQQPRERNSFFPVRPGLSLPVTIRSDMTSLELENMADFLRIIAKSRGSRAN